MMPPQLMIPNAENPLSWKYVVAAVFAVCLCARSADTTNNAPGAAQTLSVPWVLANIASNNPSLKAARARWDEMRQRVPQARAWEDLRVGVDLERSQTRRLDTYTASEWMIAQEVPVLGKNRLRARAATADAAAALEELRRRELDLAARARIACVRFALAQAQLVINAGHETILNELVSAAQNGVRAGARTEADVFAAQTELLRLIEARTDLERALSDEQSEINVLMHRPVHEELPPAAPLAFQPLALSRFRPPPSPHEDDEATFTFDWPMFQQKVQDAALRERPEVRVGEEAMRAAKARQDLARRAWLPDPELRLEARQFNGGARVVEEYDTGIFFRFPWLNQRKYRSAIAEATASLDAAKQELAAVQSETSGRIRNQVKKIEAAQTHYLFVRDRVLPLARQTFAAARPAYDGNRLTLAELLHGQRLVLEHELMLQQHLAEYLMAIAELEAASGMPVIPPAP